VNYKDARAEALALWATMETERARFMVSWRTIANFVVPWRGRYLWNRQPGLPDDQSLGSDIVNSTAGGSLRTLAAGLMSSLTNPARPWFRLTTADPTLSEIGSVRAYLFTVQRLLEWIFARSNVHNELHNCYRDMPAFGISPLLIDEDEKEVLRCHLLPIGSYGLWSDSAGRIDSMGRKFYYTIRQMRQRFGEKNLSKASQRLLAKGQLNQRREILHLVMPNEDFEYGAFATRGMKYRSLWVEIAAEENEGFLKVGGYRQFPVAPGRWDVFGADEIYGIGPVREFLPDIQQLQHAETTKVTLLDKMLTPPMQTPPGADPPSLLAGAQTDLPSILGDKVEFKPMYVPDWNAAREARECVRELEQRIKIALHEDLWRLLITRDQEDRPGGMTATEVATRHEEALTQLGPTVDRIHNELLSVLIRRALQICAERRLLPPPPKELVKAILQGEDVRVEYISVMAQAQRLLGLGAIERYASIAMQLARTFPPEAGVLDKIDPDELLDAAADMLGIPPTINRSDDQVAQIRLGRARDRQQMVNMQAAQQQAAAARDQAAAAQAQGNGDSALSRLLTQYGPAAESTQTDVTPQPVA
jgi:hypothetical protein